MSGTWRGKRDGNIVIPTVFAPMSPWRCAGAYRACRWGRRKKNRPRAHRWNGLESERIDAKGVSLGVGESGVWRRVEEKERAQEGRKDTTLLRRKKKMDASGLPLSYDDGHHRFGSEEKGQIVPDRREGAVAAFLPRGHQTTEEQADTRTVCTRIEA